MIFMADKKTKEKKILEKEKISKKENKKESSKKENKKEVKNSKKIKVENTYSIDELCQIFSVSKLEAKSYYLINNINENEKISKKTFRNFFKK